MSGRPKQGGKRQAPERGRERSRGSRGLGGDQVEGRHAVRELLLAGRRRTKEVLIAEGLDRAGIVDDIESLAHELNVPVRTVNRRRVDSEAATYAHQGVIAKASPLPEHDLDELMAVTDPFLLVLDGLTDPGNLGALLRTAECAGVTGVVLPRHRSVHISPSVTKAAAGAVEHLPMTLVGGIPAALKRMSDAGVATFGLDAAGSRSVYDLPSTATAGPVALVMGSEGKGLAKLVRQRVDMLVAIPLRGELNSLNVAAAGAIACFEMVRQRWSSPPHGGTGPNLESDRDWG